MRERIVIHSMARLTCDRSNVRTAGMDHESPSHRAHQPPLDSAWVRVRCAKSATLHVKFSSIHLFAIATLFAPRLPQPPQPPRKSLSRTRMAYSPIPMARHARACGRSGAGLASREFQNAGTDCTCSNRRRLSGRTLDGQLPVLAGGSGTVSGRWPASSLSA
jgi:hypothetical protein